MKLTVSQARNIASSLRALDGLPTPSDMGGRTVMTYAPYQFSGAFRLSIAMNLFALEQSVKSSDAAFKALQKQYEDRADQDGNIIGQDFVSFKEANDEILAAEVDVDVEAFDREELRTEENDIPGTVICGLIPLFKPKDGTNANQGRDRSRKGRS